MRNNIFVFTASARAAQDHLDDSVKEPIDVNIIERNLDEAELKNIPKILYDQGFYAWGAVPGQRNTRTWSEIEPGDTVLIYYKKRIHFVSKIVYKTQNYDLARDVWGTDDEDKTWEHIYFFEKPFKLDSAILTENFDKYLHKTFQGFTKLSDERIEKIIQDYGSIEVFLNEVFGYPLNYNEQNKDMDMDNNITPEIAEKIIVKHIYKYVTSKGFRYQYQEIANFYLSLRTKPFVILAGISGTGKTQLPRKLGEALGFDEKQVSLVPVRPDWTDSSDLLGYTSLNNKFIPKDLTLAIEQANSAPEKPFIFILDEMNLARVEHYFSDFLSVIETRRRIKDRIVTNSILREETLRGADDAEDFKDLHWPENLYLVGTVNMDETTFTFSRKVLDRANTIEMNEINLDWMETPEEDIFPLSDITNEVFKSPFLSPMDFSDKDKESIKEDIELLKSINDILNQADLHFAYRVRDEIAYYLIMNKSFKLIDKLDALDFQIVQKILPRIHGSSDRVHRVLIELLNLLEKKEFSVQTFEYRNIEDKLNEEEFIFKRSSKKIVFMLKRFDEDRFTSFWL